MKKYALISTKGDQFEDLFDNREEALNCAKHDWEHLTHSERQKYTEFFVCACELNEIGCADLDTAEIIKNYKE